MREACSHDGLGGCARALEPREAADDHPGRFRQGRSERRPAVTTASVPSVPTTSARMSGASSASSQATLPSISTTSTPSTWSVVTPCARQCSPPAFVAMLPPIIEMRREDGSGA